MKVSMGQITTLTKTMEENVLSYEKAGFDCVELAFPTVYKYLENHTVEDMRALFDVHNQRAVSAIGLASTVVGVLYARDETLEPYFKTLESQMQICQTMGCEMINIGADPDECRYEGYEEQAVKNLRRAGDLGEKYGLKVALEDSRMSRCLELVYAADHPNVGFCIDMFWYFKHGCTKEQFKIFNMSKLINIHFCDLPANFDVASMDDSIRVLPGEGVLPLHEWMEWLVENGYKGYCCLELLNEEIWKMESDAACERCMKAMEPYYKL